jgi:PST family polysaccharide transporter
MQESCETRGMQQPDRSGDSAARGVVWTFLSFGSGKAISLATTVVLARLLVPADFGLVALALLLISLLTVFNDIGLGSVLVYRQEMSERAKGTILSVMVAMSLLLGVLLIATAPLVAEVMRSPKLPPVLDGISAVLFLSGPVWFYESLLQRELAFRSELISRLTQTLTFTTVAITTAVYGAGVWSLVAGQVSSNFVYMLALFGLSPYRVRPAFDRHDAVELLRQARGYVAQGALSFIQQNTDYVAVGRILGDGALGLYSMAYRLGDLTYWGIVNPVAKVTFPVFARKHSRGESLVHPYLSALRLVLLAGCPVGVLLSASAAPFTHVILGPRWLGMIAPLTALGLWAALRPVETTASWLLNSIGRPDTVARIGVALLVPLVPAIVLAAHWKGILGVAWVLTAHMLVSTFAMLVAVARRIDVSLQAQWRTLRPIALAGASAWLAARGVATALGDTGVLWLGATVLSGLLVYGGLLLLLDRELVRDAVSRVRGALGRPRTTAVRVP